MKRAFQLFNEKLRNLLQEKAILVVITLLLSLSVFSQEEVPFIKKGNEAYKQKDYETATKQYEKSLEKKYDSHAGIFNMGNALYQQGKYDEAAEKYKTLTQLDIPEKKKKAKAYHNLGNCFMEKQEYQKAVEQYKDALRLDPTNENTRYNLAYALEKLKNEGGGGQDNQNQQNQDQQQNEDQKNQDQQNKDGDNQQDQNKDGQGKDKKEQQDQQQGGNKKNKMSKEEAEQMLKAMMENEQKLQDKNKKMEKGQPIRIEKDW